MRSFNPRPADDCGATAVSTNSIEAVWFQSAPRDDLRGDLAGRCRTRTWPSFNPRPAMICGATCTAGKNSGLRMFQSAPRDDLRGDAPGWMKEPVRQVSIRAPR